MIYQTTFYSLDSLTGDMYVLRLAKPETFVYQPGQFITLLIPDLTQSGRFLERHYSLSSHPSEYELVCTIKFPPDSRTRAYIASLASGDPITIKDVQGKYVYKNSNRRQVHLVTGSGIGPNYSMLKEWIQQGASGEVWLFFGVRDHSNIAYNDIFLSWKGKYPNFHFFPCISQEAGDEKNTFSGRVFDVLSEHMSTFDDKEFYLCGLPQMVKDGIMFLKARHVPISQMHFELFTESHQ